jgi:enamine deaminase RidA (YjgF/YER057c/UK114 family)
VTEGSALRCGALVFVGDVACGADELFPRLAEALEREGASLADLLELTTFHADVREIDDVLAAGADALPAPYPAWSPVGMVGPAAGGERIVARAIAHTGDAEKTTVVPDTISWWRSKPWSAGCRRDDFLAVAGQFGTDTDGNVVMPGHHDGQARNALNRVKETCSLLGAGLDDVVDVWSFHQDPRGIQPSLDVAVGEFFADELPAWTAVGAPALYGFGMLGQFRALAELGRRSLAALSIESGPEVRGAFEAIAALPGTLVEVVCFHKDVRDAEEVRAAGGEVLGDRVPAWTAVGMTGFRDERSVHAFHALAVSP